MSVVDQKGGLQHRRRHPHVGGGRSRSRKYASVCLATVGAVVTAISLLAMGSANAAAAGPVVTVSVVGDCTQPHTSTSFDVLDVTTVASGVDPSTHHATVVGDVFSGGLDVFGTIDDGLSDAQGNLNHTGPTTQNIGGPWMVGTQYFWVLNGDAGSAPTAQFTLQAGNCDVPTTPPPPAMQQIAAKALTGHECNANEWHFVINQVDKESDAPASIHVTWANGNSLDVNRTAFTGGVAHYTTTANLGSTVTSATAEIYATWSGQFNLSHGPCAITTTSSAPPSTSSAPPSTSSAPPSTSSAPSNTSVAPSTSHAVLSTSAKPRSSLAAAASTSRSSHGVLPAATGAFVPPAGHTGDGLARTGSDFELLTLVGLVMMLAGGVIFFAPRLRESRAHR